MAWEAQHAVVCVAYCGCECDLRWIYRFVNDEAGAYFLGRILRGSACKYGDCDMCAEEENRGVIQEFT